MTEIELNEAVALLKADLIWSSDFENIKQSLLAVLLAPDLQTAKLSLVNSLLGETNHA